MSGGWLWLPLLLVTCAVCRGAAADPKSWDWLIVDEADPRGTSTLLRRITPKSVFVAPTFGCSEGYRQDSLGRCIKHVKVDQAEQWKFYLDRLNSMYAPKSGKKPQKEAEPFHINLPIGSENSQEDIVVKKRVPPVFTVKTTTTTRRPTTTESTTTPPPVTTTSTPVQELTTPEATQPTMVEPSEVTSTERELDLQSEITTETRKKYETTQFDSTVMLGDQPVGTEDLSAAETLETPKNHKQVASQLPDKPFVIIVTNEPTARPEETTVPPSAPITTEREEEETTSEAPATTTEAPTEGTTETTPRYTTDSTPRPTEYVKLRDIVKPSNRPNVRFTASTTLRPGCDPRYDSSGCEPSETEFVSHDRVVANPAVPPLPPSLPMLEPNTQVRFPSESFVPVRKTQTFVRFPESVHPHDDRPQLWWPSWHVRQHPAIRGWPPPEDPRADPALHKQYPPHPQWSESDAWRRRFFQRD